MNPIKTDVCEGDLVKLSKPPRAWIPGLVVLIVCIGWVLFWYRDTASAMVSIWYRSETFAHAFVVPPISLWLIWRQRQHLALYQPRSSPLLWPLLALAGFGWLLGQFASINALTQFALVATLILLVPAVLGLAVARAITFPLLFLFFAVPFGEFVMPQLMDWTAKFTVIALRLTGIPVLQEGLQFVIPTGHWSVIEACSGVRYLLASLTVGTLYAYLTYRSLTRRWIFIGVSILVPIFANWFRAYMIVMLGHLSGNTIATGVDHLIYGWLFFGVVIMLMFMIGARWAEHPAEEVPAEVRRAGQGLPESPGRALLAVVVIAALTAAPRLAFDRIGYSQATGEPRLVPIAEAGLVSWTPASTPRSNWHPAFENPSTESTTWFESNGRAVGVYIGYYRNQSFDRKLVSSNNVLVRSRDPDWAEARSGTRPIEAGGRALVVRTAELRLASEFDAADRNRLVVWRWYWVGGRLTSSDVWAKIYSALAHVSGHGDESAVVMVYTTKDQPGGADAALEAFVGAALGPIETALSRTGSQR